MAQTLETSARRRWVRRRSASGGGELGRRGEQLACEPSPRHMVGTMTVNSPTGAGACPARRGGDRRSARHAGGDGRVRVGWQCRGRRHRRQCRHRRHRAAPVRDGWRPPRAGADAGRRDRRAQRQRPRRFGRRRRRPPRRTGTRRCRSATTSASVTVPGCVDGWMALHERFGRLDLAAVLGPAIRLAAGGFPASPLLVGSLELVDDAARHNLAVLAEQARRPGAPVRRAGVALALQAIVNGGRSAFYLGAFGEGLIELGPRSVHRGRPGTRAGRLGRAAGHGRPRRAARHDRTELAGLPGARRGPPGRRARCARRSRRSGLAPSAHRDLHRRRDGPPGRPPRRRRRRRARRPDRRDEPRSSTASERADVRPPPCRATPPTCAPPTTRAWPSASSSPTHRVSDRGWSSRRPASTSTTAGSGSARRPVTRPSSGRAGGRRTRCARPWRLAAASSSPSSARWAAMRNRRSSSS